ncbi:DNA/RNA polymerases superfamily protein [Gossypium australe]|uniref:DNA/RNA polymerases superfamily protein n=1 Tax=Gossypium australe TaxID=47621 RepID=A0A5B6WKL6_9ROSI|nr:DNA/RNA polymerases superfamily protein [Gossypium australe]
MLQTFVIDFESSWESYLPLAKFVYNKYFQSSIQIASYEAVYSRRYRTPTMIGISKSLFLEKSIALWPQREDASHIIPVETIEVQPDFSYEKYLVEILARKLKEYRNKRVPLVKVLWRNHSTDEATCELTAYKRVIVYSKM